MTNRNTPSVIAPKTTSIQGRIYLEPYLYKFVLGLENLSYNTPLNLKRHTLLCTTIRARLITKTQLGNVNTATLRRNLIPLSFVVSGEYQRRLQIFLTAEAITDINNIARLVFVELASSHILRAIRHTKNRESAKTAYLGFLNQYGLQGDDFEFDSLQKLEYRLRETRNQSNIHIIKKKQQNTIRYSNQLIIQYE